jgi:GntR family transcriptional regulator/MocR family aminotransferase
MDLQLTLDRSRRIPLSIQIAHGVRDAISTQRVLPGARLPPTRELAQRLNVSRMVVVEAYAWLVAEGYAESRQGSGVYVLKTLTLLQTATRPAQDPPRRTDILPATPVMVDFRPGLPALDLFPRQAWKTALSHAALYARTDQLGYGPVEGLPQLRRVIAEYVARTRGLPVAPERVVITVGAAQAMDLILRVLSPLNSMAIEDPCPEPVHRLVRLHQIQPEAVPVDEFGMRVDLLGSTGLASRVVHVIPSHQYPTGVAMRLDRRIELLNWAEQQDAAILEDDYDSEFRFDQAPPVSLAALDTRGRVIYIGSFSKTMYPGLRLGFCILPEAYISRFLELKWFSDRCAPILEQLALAEWLENGLFERHVRKMRTVYARRRQAVLGALAEYFGAQVSIQGVPAGMHVLLTFHIPLNETEIVTRALQAGIKVYPASPCFVQRFPEQPAILLGFGQINEATITRGVRQLAVAIQARNSTSSG